MDAGTVLSIVFGAILAAFSVTLVGYSFVRRRPEASQPTPSVVGTPSAESSEVSQGFGDGVLDLELDAIYDSINTLELEFQLGKMPAQQFEEQFQSYRLQAAAALKQQMEAGQRGPLWGLEQEVLMARSALRSSENGPAPCPDCSAPVPNGVANCLQCGAEIVLRTPRPSPNGGRADRGS